MKEGKKVYNYYQQQPTTSFKSPLMLKGHPVSSLEEVKATSIDFDGSIFYFPDIANKRIYTKAVDISTGIATLNMYELKPLPQEVIPDTSEYITRTEFEQAIAQLIKQIPVEKETKQSPSKYKEAF